MANNFTGREIIVSKFEVFPDDPDWCSGADIPKTVGEIIINAKDKNVAYKHISGWEPPLFIILTVMGANKNWMRVLSNSEYPDKKYLIITSWKRDYVSEYFLASWNEKGLPVAEKTLVKTVSLCGVSNFILKPYEYLLLLAAATNTELWSRERRLRSLIRELEFRYIK